MKWLFHTVKKRVIAKTWKYTFQMDLQLIPKFTVFAVKRISPILSMLFGARTVRRSFPNIGAVDTRWKRKCLGSTSKIVFVFMLDLEWPFYITRPLTGLIESICWVPIFIRFLAREKDPGYIRYGAFPYFETNLWIPRVKSQIRTRYLEVLFPRKQNTTGSSRLLSVNTVTQNCWQNYAYFSFTEHVQQCKGGGADCSLYTMQQPKIH